MSAVVNPLCQCDRCAKAPSQSTIKAGEKIQPASCCMGATTERERPNTAVSMNAISKVLARSARACMSALYTYLLYSVTLRNRAALIATITVESDIKTAAIAGCSMIP